MIPIQKLQLDILLIGTLLNNRQKASRKCDFVSSSGYHRGQGSPTSFGLVIRLNEDFTTYYANTLGSELDDAKMMLCLRILK
jgi:hypothetical protein